MAFFAGAHVGARINGHVNGLTFANMRMPRIEAAAAVQPHVGDTLANQ
jgi:hypothetical protein